MALLLAGIGAGAGVLVAMVVAPLLFEVSAVDPLTYVLVVTGLLTAAALASYVLALRVARVGVVEECPRNVREMSADVLTSSYKPAANAVNGPNSK